VSRSGVRGFSPALLRQARERAGLSQRELALRVLASRADWPPTDPDQYAREVDNVRLQIGDYEAERGHTVPRADKLHQLAQAVGVDVLALLEPDTAYTLDILRARRGMLQADVIAGGLGITAAYLGRIERGHASLSPDRYAVLARILDVTVEELRLTLTGSQTIAAVHSPR
jgi:transcriptional regulator with XRE-family HTH domain